QAAVATYLFNSQILTLPGGGMLILAPQECEEHPETHAFLQSLMSSPDNPIRQVHYSLLRESMHNGGGPACLRLRAVLTAQERQAAHQGVFLTPLLYERLKEWIAKHYRDRLCVDDLSDPQFLLETQE